MNRNGIFYFSMALLVSLGYWVQSRTLFSGDVAYLLYATKLLLSGEKYGRAIFETNPPMVLYLYSPVYLLIKWSGIAIFDAFRLYIIFLSLMSAGISCFCIQKIIPPTDKIVTYFLVFGLLVLFLFLPFVEFGQRDHLFFMLSTPYLFLIAARLGNKKIHPLLAATVGMMLGLGVGMKPFFMLLPMFIELYMMLKTKNILSWIRVESLAMGLIVLSYVAYIAFSQPDYCRVVLVFVFRYYFSVRAAPWVDLLTPPYMMFCFSTILSYFMCYRYDRYFSIGSVLWIALLAMTAVFIIPMVPWYYHALPAFSLSFLLMLYGFGQVLSTILLRREIDRVAFYKYIIGWTAGVVIVFFSPLFFCYHCYDASSALHRNVAYEDMVTYINNKTEDHSVYCIQLTNIDCFPLVYDTHSIYASRFPGWWWYRGLRALEKKNTASSSLPSFLKDKSYFLGLVTQDMNYYSPRWIVVDQARFQQTEADPSFQIMDYLLDDPRFAAVWKQYHYVKSFEGERLYERN